MRKAYGLTQVELARAFSVTPQCVNNWEKAWTRPQALALTVLEQLERLERSPAMKEVALNGVLTGDTAQMLYALFDGVEI